MKDTINTRIRLENIYSKTWEEKFTDKAKEIGKVFLFSTAIVCASLIPCVCFILMTN